MKKRVLILCTGNSCRSQMAEALWRQIGGEQWEVCSAGSHPAGFVVPGAVAAMREIGVDISGNESKPLKQFVEQEFDVVVTVCDNAREACPVFPRAKEMLHWPFEDPTGVEGDEETRAARFRETREAIAAKIRAYLAASVGVSQ